MKQKLDKYTSELSELSRSKKSLMDKSARDREELERVIELKVRECAREQELRVVAEADSRRSREEVARREQEVVRERELMRQEQEYIASLKREETYEQAAGEVKEDDSQDLARIEASPKEAAVSFMRLMKATQKELRIAQQNNTRLVQKQEELKAKFADLKAEARESVQELMNAETQLAELRRENEQMQDGGKIDEASIRKEVEDLYRERLTFKASEVEAMTVKLARITQSNIELSTKNARLEANNGELGAENELYRNKCQSLEMELEMTKVNNERDME